jgi:tagatose-6-phosphate ketose/aldose isomerase
LQTTHGDVALDGGLTRGEIFHQPELWLTTLERARGAGWTLAQDRPVIVAGAGTSAYAGAAVAHAGRLAVAVPTTDLLTAHPDEIERLCPGFSAKGALLSLARSGDSPESLGVVERLRHIFPKVEHYAVTCNANGQLARDAKVRSLVLDPRTNDRSLAMTSSFSNLVLGGMLLFGGAQIGDHVAAIAERTERSLPGLLESAEAVTAQQAVPRAVILGDAALRPATLEAALKILEMTNGDVVSVAETYLGLRHGPMSFLRGDSLVLCFLSSDGGRARYESDLIRELQRKGLGRIVAIGEGHAPLENAAARVSAMAPELPDALRTPFEIVFAQLLAYSLSLRTGHNPDNPSPGGVITRVVAGFTLHNIDAHR